jgi:hypothetical protein
MKNKIDLEKEIKRREYDNQFAPFPVHDTEVIADLKIYLKYKNEMITKKADYNNVPVTYCKTCGSLHIKTVEFDNGQGPLDYCVSCSNTELGSVHIEEWEDIYEDKYGHKFLDKKD